MNPIDTTPTPTADLRRSLAAGPPDPILDDVQAIADDLAGRRSLAAGPPILLVVELREIRDVVVGFVGDRGYHGDSVT